MTDLVSWSRAAQIAMAKSLPFGLRESLDSGPRESWNKHHLWSGARVPIAELCPILGTDSSRSPAIPASV